MLCTIKAPQEIHQINSFFDSEKQRCNLKTSFYGIHIKTVARMDVADSDDIRSGHSVSNRNLR